MAVQWQISVDIGHKEFMDIKSMPILEKGKYVSMTVT